MNKTKIVIIGGGAAGVFAAINTAANSPHCQCILLEASHQLLSKVRVSGGGRCNVTHHCFEPKELVKHYPRGHKELLSLFYRFNPEDTIAWFAQRNVQLHTEADGRMFPTTNDSQTIIDCFKNELIKHQVQVLCSHRVQAIAATSDGFDIKIKDQHTISAEVLRQSGGKARD